MDLGIQVVAFRNGSQTGGVITESSKDLAGLLDQLSTKLDMDAKFLFDKHGAIITSLSNVHSGDIVYASPDDKFLKTVDFPDANVVSHTKLGEWITLNVGGKLFTTTRTTLTTKDPNSMLARMFSDDLWHNTLDSSGAILIDRSPKYFEPILNYLRGGELVVDKGINLQGVLAEARFYGITSAIELLEARVEDEEPVAIDAPMTRQSLVEKIIATPPEWELRCQGVNFEGADLSKLDLRHVNFKYAILRHADMAMSNLTCCNFERADLAGAKLDSATLLGAKMLCVNLEGASMKGCNFEDPAGTRTSMEGANMKHVNLEGSRMAGINLRVANLKNANLQNCDLRGAVLAGADLENCNLSGCDLQEANLRGANLKGATFELMLNPLHMSQAVP